MQPPSVITITTDFGLSSPYVAEMKGAILSVNANVQLVDGTHLVEPQNVLHGALCLRQFADAFPDGSVHVVVVDPGVGTDRRILLVEANGQYFIAPDNGVLTFPLENATRVRVIDNDSFWRENVTATFHGRDIMGPVAAHLCSSVSPELLSSACDTDPIKLPIDGPIVTFQSDGKRHIQGRVIMIDSFGNLITNIHQGTLPTREFWVECQSKCLPFVNTYGEADTGQLVSLIGSSGWLELAVNAGKAAKELNTTVGESVLVAAEES